jgi:phosphotransferase family enzyme
VDLSDADAWIRARVTPTGSIENVRVRPWSTVLRVPLDGTTAWFKACAPVQAFEAHMTAALYTRWPDRVTEMLDHDDERGWMLMLDAGTRMKDIGNPPEWWLELLPAYSELQCGETAYASHHLAHDSPDLRVETLPAHYDEMLRRDLPLPREETERLQRFAPRFGELCDELASCGIPPSVQHDDLHHGNVYRQRDRLRVLDWGDASVGHPFISLVVTFRFLDEINGLPPDDPWFARLRDAYLEPWGSGLTDVFELALRVGAFAHNIAWMRQRDALPPEERPAFDEWYQVVLRRALRYLE